MDSQGSFLCKRCGYSCKYKWMLVRHLQGKRKCNPSKTQVSTDMLLKELEDQHNKTCLYFCDTCFHGFKSRQGLCYHRKQCTTVATNEPIENNNAEIMETLRNMQEQITSIQSITVGTTNITNNINQTFNQTINQTQNINIIVPFGQENTDFIYKLMSFLNECCSKPEAGVKKLIRNIHFHEHHPENYNITFADGKIMIFDGEQWCIPPSKNKVLDDTIEKVVDIMDTHYTTKLESDPDPRFMLTRSSMVAFQRKMQRKDIEIIRGLRKDTEELIKAETEKVHSKHPNLPSTL
jgi:hypothetical protein